MTVEAALLLPLLVLLTFGVIEYGWVLLKTQQIGNAARGGARCAVRADATNAEVEAAVSTLMSSAGIQGYQLTLPGDVAQIPPASLVTVQISVPYQNIQLAGAPFVPMPAHLQARVSMAKEGP
jgi:Flp pilus assembly protein TadG